MAQLAVTRTGAAYLPIDPQTPRARIDAILSQVGPVAVVATADVELGVPVVRFTDAAVPPVTPSPVASNSHGLAYLIATSGSTGVPKVVEIEHRSLANLVAWHRRTFAVTTRDRACMIATVSFDASVWETWAHLAAGATLVVPPDGVRRSPSQLLRWLADERITVSFVPTPIAEELLTLVPPAGLRLRVLMTGGDVLHRALSAKRGPTTETPFELLESVPTECTVIATYARVHAAKPGGAPPPIGRPIANVSAHVLDTSGHELPVGAIGRLHLGGIGLARGYHGAPEATAAAFAPSRLGERLYHTGDRARRLPDGALQFLVRADGQLKVRGVRVEAGDVIAQLLSHTAVRDAVVVPSERGLAAYFVASAPVTAAELRTHVAERLPAAVVPTSYTELDALPLTRHDKVDLAALPQPAAAAGVGGARAVRTEEAVAELFAELLRAHGVGPEDDFFALGGHSLLATRLIMRIRVRFAVEVALRLVFENGTARSIAGAINAARRAGPGPDRPALQAVDRRRHRTMIAIDGTLMINDALRAACCQPIKDIIAVPVLRMAIDRDDLVAFRSLWPPKRNKIHMLPRGAPGAHVDTAFLRRLCVLIVSDGEVTDESTRDFLKSYMAELELAARASR